MAAETNQTEKSPVEVATRGDGEDAVVVVATDSARKRQSLSDIFTIVSFGSYHTYLNIKGEALIALGSQGENALLTAALVFQPRSQPAPRSSRMATRTTS